jgi:4-amino-4-deoxy-L-arabinose transferase-like glycosyltransferase
MNRYLKYIALSILVIFTLSRFINIEADFPKRYTDGGFVLTDEGWYCNGAVSKILTGKWVGDGFQSMPIIPVNHIVQFIAMSIFGVSATVSRSVIALFFVVFIVALYFICIKLYDEKSALIAIVPIATSPVLFAYSRISLLEIEMLAFVLLSILFASYKKLIPSILFMFIALLTKPTAIFAIVPIGYIILKNCGTKKAVVSQGIIIVTYGFYLMAIHDYFPEAFSGFFKANVSGRIELSPLKAIENLSIFDVVLMSLSTTMVPIAVSGKKWLFPVLLFSFSIIMVAANGYQPNRYFIIMTLPLCMIIAAGLHELKDTKKYVAFILAFSFIINGSIIFRMINKQEYKLKNYCQNVDTKKIQINMINTVTLFNGHLIRR